MAKLRISMLGGWSVEADGHAVVVPSRKARGLLAYLARTPGRRHSREALAALFWPESAERQARANLRQSLKLLRRALHDAPESIVAEGDNLSFAAGAAAIDVVDFEALHRAGAPDDLARAAALYRGEFLAGLNPASSSFHDWAVVDAVRLRDRAIACLAGLMDHQTAVGRRDAAIQTGQRLLALDPLQEPVHRRLIALYLAQGQRGLARAQFCTCRDIFRRDLGVDPELETAALLGSHAPAEAGVRVPAQRAEAPGSERSAVAVLRFARIGGDEAEDYLRDGLCEEIITALAGWRSFPLISSTSTLTIADGASGSESAGAALGALYLVDGAVRRAGPRLRITARLMESATGRHLWAERFDFDFGDIFDVQQEAARKISAMVEPAIERAELERIRLKGTGDLSAWDLWLRGLSCLRRCTAEGNAAARHCFREALRIDCHYSDAFTGLAKSHSQDVLFRSAHDRKASIRQALEAGRRAVALDPYSSDAHLVFAAANVWAGNVHLAIPETETAIELNPSNAHARMALGNRLDLVGETERGVLEMEHGIHLNPRDPRRFSYMGFLARAYTSLGRAEEALDWASGAVRLRPDHPDLYYRLAICLANLDRVVEARAAIEECEQLQPGFLRRQAGWRPYADEARNAAFFAGLRQCGLGP